MDNPKVSVIIPAYNGADFLGETIQSVLGQTYPNFELIIVDDASTDNTAEVVGQFKDSRIKYLVHEVNQGADASRLTATRASKGDLLALLDQDDLFHPEKLQAHVTFLDHNLEIGFSYNSRFEMYFPAKIIKGISRPPQELTLTDLALGFPIAPSDWVSRRKWLSYWDLSHESSKLNGGEYTIMGRLFMSGCRFGSIDRALNYRRFHSRRRYSNLAARCQSELMAQQNIFNDPRCPANVLALRNTAFKNTYRTWSYYALVQEETALGQEFIQEAARLQPGILTGKPCELLRFYTICSIDDESMDHEDILIKIFNQLPKELSHMNEQYSLAIAQGHLLKGVRAIIWDRPEVGYRHLKQAVSLRIRPDETLISTITQNLLDYEIEFGDEAASNKIHSLLPYLGNLGGRAIQRQLIGNISINRAFQSFRIGDFDKVPKMALRAIASNPGYLANRGMWSIFFRSIINGQTKPV